MQYVTLQEGARITGKSEMTIRRLTKKPGARTHTIKDTDNRLYIALSYLLKHYPLIKGLEPETRSFEATPQPPAEMPPALTGGVQPDQEPIQPIQMPTQPVQAIQDSVYTDMLKLLQEQNQELRKDKEYLQGKLDEVSRQLSREQERTNFLLLQSNPQPGGNVPPADEEKEQARPWWKRLFS